MIVDSSAVVAVLRTEPEPSTFLRAIEFAGKGRISAVSYIEAAIVIDRGRDAIARLRFYDFFRVSRIAVETVTPGKPRLRVRATAILAEDNTRPA
jgi:ribonuclease VapC